MIEPRYFCTGTCGAIVTEEEFHNGLQKCGTESCNFHNEPFEKGLFCTTCNKRIQANETTQHQH